MLLPPLEPQYCVEQAMNAILIDQPLVCIPRLTYLPVISRAYVGGKKCTCVSFRPPKTRRCDVGSPALIRLCLLFQAVALGSQCGHISVHGVRQVHVPLHRCHEQPGLQTTPCSSCLTARERQSAIKAFNLLALQGSFSDSQDILQVWTAVRPNHDAEKKCVCVCV